MPFDRVFAVHAMLFRAEPDLGLRQLRQLLRPGGLPAVAHQPRAPAATDETSAAGGRKSAVTFGDAGFADLRVGTSELEPAVGCALGVTGALG